MEVVFAATDPTDPTLVTVKYLLFDAIIVPKVTILAVVLAEHLTTSNTVTAWWLSREAGLANDFPNLSSVDLVRVRPTALCLIMAVTAPKNIFTAGCYNAAAAAIVAAALRCMATHNGWATREVARHVAAATTTQSCTGSRQEHGAKP
eukprot:CAMPEP_0172790784 /NCGR_PEP_ID=MMETSP1074-20121228/208142_1 /TAXON_ID=2916 /ORGANISM="Ceratium fusus, Strain PA161109" /LENGTH=147 /DNA_ID=CAMNT_0013627837 /DNA_START=576 /DNA_END=1016 /DNA_ORIENTATION=+